MRRRILRVAITATVVALALMAVPLAVAVHQLYLSDERAELERAALRAVTTVGSGAISGDPIEFPDTEPDIAVAFYGADGRLVSGHGPGFSATVAAAGATPADLGSLERVEDGLLVSYVPVSSGETVIGAVRAAAPSSAVWQRTLLTWAAMLAIGCVAVSVAVFIARRLSRRLTTPLDTLVVTAQALGDGDFSTRSQPSGIQEIDRAGAALDATAARLAALVERERSFSANASHQLRTPLTALRLRLEAAAGADQPTEVRALAIDSLAGADALERTIDELLLLARTAHGPTHTAPYGIDGLLTGQQQRWTGPAAAVGRRLRVQVDPDTPELDCSPSAVEQILDVLLDNALRHGDGTVQVLARSSAGTFALAVRDDGCSISPAAELFTRGWSGGAGHGIGLALARELAESQRGRLLLTRTAPSTEFTLLLPAAEPARPSTTPPAG